MSNYSILHGSAGLNIGLMKIIILHYWKDGNFMRFLERGIEKRAGSHFP